MATGTAAVELAGLLLFIPPCAPTVCKAWDRDRGHRTWSQGSGSPQMPWALGRWGREGMLEELWQSS